MASSKASTKRTTKDKLDNSKVLGTERWINSETGEIAETQTIVRQQADANFKKLWVSHILEAIDELGGAKLKFVFWVFDAADRQNRIIGSYQQLADESGVSLATVSRIMGKLKSADVIRREAQCVHRLNPNICFAGSSDKRLDVMIRYEKIDNRQRELPVDAAMSDADERKRNFGEVVPQGHPRANRPGVRVVKTDAEPSRNGSNKQASRQVVPAQTDLELAIAEADEQAGEGDDLRLLEDA